jgi:excisionase family DNA binding protein
MTAKATALPTPVTPATTGTTEETGSDKPAVPRMALRIDEVAESLGICRQIAYGLVRSGKLRSVRISGNTIIVPVRELEEFLLLNSQGGQKRL